ncbi:Asp-tRNA(Asn)/Glu-tRNA(Gln) amidotransferase subunit GatB [Myxococcota bacterium]|nr:Asp-tRNA(Asn)/Glu-tRNA(Gln) amidotransferase subunit GatB [Myxococcota bacterium]
MSVPVTLQEALERYQPVIGLEVHAQLLTRSKIFSDAPADYDPEHANRFVNEYCLGMPGVLPVLNRAAVDMAIRAGLALGCAIREKSVFARKHYFYPDLPKGYQISQYELPLCEGGELVVPASDGGTRRVGIIRIHMEEDAGKSTHVDGAPYSLVDYNRAGFPLIEIVSAPDIRSAQEAGDYLRELRAILVALGVCDGNMEEGSFRCDANVSIHPRGTSTYGTRCEIKNVNSFRFVEQAIEHEILRHAKILASGGTIEQETRLFDSVKKETRSMRSKEEAHDYRYMPDPDLPPLVVSPTHVEALRATIPELPAAKRARYTQVLGIPEEHARTFTEERAVAEYFDEAVRAWPEGAVAIANLVKGEVLRELKDDPSAIERAKLRPEALAELVRLKESDKISSSQQKKLFAAMWTDGTSLEKLMESEGSQLDDPAALIPIIDGFLAKSPKEAEKLRAGQMNLMGFFVGQVMKATGGKAKPTLVKDLLLARLEGKQS